MGIQRGGEVIFKVVRFSKSREKFLGKFFLFESRDNIIHVPSQCLAAFSCACKLAIAFPDPYNTLARTCTLLVVVQEVGEAEDPVPVPPPEVELNCSVVPA